ncbi:serine/threonine protein kinase [Arthrobacter sp. UYP6]|uniref:serine/threonine-protein kinase n=1 Tax=Arthrobacter sp. UYP6 TaxID=1756378 RepID=UPI003392B687
MEFNEPPGRVPPPALEQGYRADRLLGAGRTAHVWLAARETDGARLALKISAVAAGGPGSTFETRRELNILSRFEHENLLRLHTVLETDRGPGLLMEWAPGDSLARLSKARGPLQPGEAVTVLVGIASALSYLHALGVSHGDVSPGNILFTANGKPLLGDLGTARLFGAGTGPAPAPEGDVFALASVGWLILTGRALPPAERRLPLAALVPEIPPALAEAIDAGLQEEPERRPDATEFARLVFAAATAQPLDLVPAETGAAVPGLQTRRARRSREGTSGGLGLWVRKPGHEHRRRSGRGAEHRQPRVMLLGAAAVLVAGTMGLGAVAVAAPEVLQGKGQEQEPGQGQEQGRGKEQGQRRDAASGEESAASDGTGTATGERSGEAGENAQAGTESGSAPAVPGTGGPVTDDGAKAAAPESSGEFSLAGATEADLWELVRGEDPVPAARALAELRSRAFGAADADLLEGVNAPRSPAMETDQAEIAKLEAAGTVLSGLAVEVLSAGPALPRQEGRVSVRAAVSTSGYTESEPGGGRVRNVAAVSRQDVVLVMLNTADGWRIEDILAPPA